MRSVLNIAFQGVRSRLGRSALTAISLFVGILAIVVIQAGAGAARDAVLARSVLQGGRAVTLSLESSGGAATWARALELRKALDTALLETGGGSALLLDTDMLVDSKSVGLTLFEGPIRTIRPFPVREGAWPDASGGLAIPLAINAPTAASLGIGPGSTVTCRLGRMGINVTGVVACTVDDGQDEPHAYTPLPQSGTWPLELATVEPVRVLAHVAGADEQRLRNVVEAEYRRVVPDSDPPEVVRVDQEDEMARQLRSIALVFSIVAALSLVVGALGILNIGLATLRERADELSLRRSFGATRAEVVTIIVVEGQVIAIAASAVALGIGIAAFPTVTALISNNSLVTRQAFPLASAFAGVAAGCAAAFLGSLAPALRAGKVPIASIMRG